MASESIVGCGLLTQLWGAVDNQQFTFSFIFTCKQVFLVTGLKRTSLGNRDDCVRVLMCNSDGGVRNLGQQVHQVTYAIVDHPPVSGEAPDTQKYKNISQNIHNTDDPYLFARTPLAFIRINLKTSSRRHLQLQAMLTDQWYACMKSLIATCLLA